MPVRIAVRRSCSGGDAPESELTFDGARIVIGRGASSDVRLPDASVSLRHATIHIDAGKHTIVDEHSTNGTFVGGTRLDAGVRHELGPEQIVFCGRFELRCTVGPAPIASSPGSRTRDLALAMVAEELERLGRPREASLRVVDGPDAGTVLELRDEGRDYLVGRADSCDLPLADADASREHAAFKRNAQGVWVRDLGSKNGLLLEGASQPITELLLRPGDTIQIGASYLVYEDPRLSALSTIERAEDVSMHPDELREILREADERQSRAPSPQPNTPASDVETNIYSANSSASAHTAPIEDRAVSTAALKSRHFAAVDILVVIVAIAVLGASAAGLVWLLGQ